MPRVMLLLYSRLLQASSALKDPQMQAEFDSLSRNEEVGSPRSGRSPTGGKVSSIVVPCYVILPLLSDVSLLLRLSDLFPPSLPFPLAAFSALSAFQPLLVFFLLLLLLTIAMQKRRGSSLRLPVSNDATYIDRALSMSRHL